MTQSDFHGFEDSVRWRLVPTGVEIEGSGVERTRGAPITVTRVWEAYATDINRVARKWRVPSALIDATICTESSGRRDAIRLEPGYVSDDRTPNKVSAGLMQTLISTAREAIQASVDRRWMLVPANAIDAGTAYIAQQARITRFDPPLVGAAYNAGRLAYQGGTRNRWKLRQFPIGTGAHVDRFVQFFNDAVIVLARHSTPPAVGLDAITSDSPSPRRTSGQVAATTPIAITFGTNANARDVTVYSRQVLEEILRRAGLTRVLISSTSRTPADQARVMYTNLETHGVAAQKRLYGTAGDKVIDVYAHGKVAGKSAAQIRADMEAKIVELGPTTVSRHASDPSVLNVFDVAPSSITDRRAFEQAVRADTRVATFLTPPTDPGYHLEIPQERTR